MMAVSGTFGARVLRAWLFSLCVLLAGVVAPASAADKAQQRELAARKAYAAGEYEKALDMYAQLYADTLHPVYLRNIGRCHQKMRNPQKAIDAFRDYLAKINRVTEADKNEVAGYIREMEALMTTTHPTEATPTPVPTPAPPPAPAPSVLTAVPPPPEPAGNLMATAPVDHGDDDAPIYTRWWFWTGVGAVVVGAVVVGLVVSAGSSKPGCPPATMGNCQ